MYNAVEMKENIHSEEEIEQARYIDKKWIW